MISTELVKKGIETIHAMDIHVNRTWLPIYLSQF